jgi:uncharacterized protein YneF (UPF0154 family)
MFQRLHSVATSAGGARNPTRTYRLMLLWSLALTLVALILVLAHSVNGLAVATFGLLLALSALVIGALAGFLFAIPRALQQSGNVTDGDVTGKYAVNTNLEQISDWLTKILVGVGLVELSQVPHGFSRLTDTLAPGFGNSTSSPLIAGVVVTLFGSWGFFLGYLLTRTYLTAAFKDFDTVSPDDVRSTLQKLRHTLSDTQDDPAKETRALRPPPGDTIPPTHNREPLEEPDPLPEDYDTGDLLTLRDQAVSLLRRLVGSAGSERFMPPSEMVKILVHRGVLDNPAASALDELFEIADEVNAGAVLKGRVADTVRNTGSAVLRQLSKLASTAAARFEEHVLTTLHHEAPTNWKILDDAEISPDGSLKSESDIFDDRHVRARIDAVVSNDSTNVAVEVRARLDEDSAQLRALELWLEAVPENIPVLLVIPNSRAVNRRLWRILERSTRHVQVLSWDDEATQLISAIQKLQQIR